MVLIHLLTIQLTSNDIMTQSGNTYFNFKIGKLILNVEHHNNAYKIVFPSITDSIL